MVAILQKSRLRDFDWLIAVLAIGIVSFGAWEIHNAQPTETFWQKQLIGLGIAMVAMLACLDGAPQDYTVGVKTGMLHGYKLTRINVILDPENADKRGFGYHTWQSMVTVGEGGLTGARGSEYSQSSLKFLPEPHTDFIFAVTAETTGFIGCLLLLASYALLLTRLINDARRSRDRTGMLVIMAIVGGLIFQIFINVGMALGFLPVIGVPLPLMSAGLSSVLATFIAIGFAISVQLRRFVN